MTKKLYKVTCTSQTYTHYWVRADNKKMLKKIMATLKKL